MFHTCVFTLTDWAGHVVPVPGTVGAVESGWAWIIRVVGRLQWAPVSFWASLARTQASFIRISTVITRYREGTCATARAVVTQWADTTVTQLLAVETSIVGAIRRIWTVRRCSVVSVNTPVSR